MSTLQVQGEVFRLPDFGSISSLTSPTYAQPAAGNPPTPTVRQLPTPRAFYPYDPLTANPLTAIGFSAKPVPPKVLTPEESAERIKTVFIAFLESNQKASEFWVKLAGSRCHLLMQGAPNCLKDAIKQLEVIAQYTLKYAPYSAMNHDVNYLKNQMVLLRDFHDNMPVLFHKALPTVAEIYVARIHGFIHLGTPQLAKLAGYAQLDAKFLPKLKKDESPKDQIKITVIPPTPSPHAAAAPADLPAFSNLPGFPTNVNLLSPPAAAKH